MSKAPTTNDLTSYLRHVPAVVLSAEFFIGGFPRVFRSPFRSLHNRIYVKTTRTLHQLYPLVPFRDVRAHMIYVGAWMMGTGGLLAHPKTRGNMSTLGLVLFWTGAGAWSQARTGMPYWLPLCNAILGTVVYVIENHF